MSEVLIIDPGTESVKYTYVNKSLHVNDDTPYVTEFTNLEEQSRRHTSCTPERCLNVLANITEKREAIDFNNLTLMWLLDSFTTRKEKEILLTCCFEELGCRQVALHSTAHTSLYSAGLTSGLVVDVGYHNVQVSSVLHNRLALSLSACLEKVGMRCVDEALSSSLSPLFEPSHKMLHLLKVQHSSLPINANAFPFFNNVSEYQDNTGHCTVITNNYDIDDDNTNQKETTEVTLPDGKKISVPISHESITAASSRALFSPHYIPSLQTEHGMPVISVPETLKYLYEKASMTYYNLNKSVNTSKVNMNTKQTTTTTLSSSYELWLELSHESSTRNLQWICSGGGALVGGLISVIQSTLEQHAMTVHTPLPQSLSSLIPEHHSEENHYHHHVRIKRKELARPRYAAIDGGVIASRLASFKTITHDASDYDEDGPHYCVSNHSTKLFMECYEATTVIYRF